LAWGGLGVFAIGIVGACSASSGGPDSPPFGSGAGGFPQGGFAASPYGGGPYGGAAGGAQAIELDPQDAKGRNAEMLYAIGDANYKDDRFAEARNYFDRLVKEYENSDWAISGMERLAGAEYKLGHRDAAVSTYWKVVEKKPDDSSTLNGFAWFCSQRKIGLGQALPAAQKAAELSNRDPGILDTLAEVYFAMGDFDNALKIGEEALAKEPNDTYFKDQVAKYKKAKAEAEQARR